MEIRNWYFVSGLRMFAVTPSDPELLIVTTPVAETNPDMK